MFARMREDIAAVQGKDPAAHSALEVLLCYPGVHALWLHRGAHALWSAGLRTLARCVSNFSRWITGIEIHPGAQIGRRVFIDHGMGVVIGETAEIGSDVMMYHGVTLGGVSSERGKRHPTIEDGVVIGAGAKVLGAIRIGKGSRIGANAVVVKDVAPERVVVGIPGRAIERHEPQHAQPDLRHDDMPDVVESHLRNMLERIEQLEKAAGVDPRSVPEPDYYL